MREVPTVVVRFTREGDQQLYVFGKGPVRLLCVDEAAPDDRVFEVLTRLPFADLAKLVPPGSPIGNAGEPRHPALAARLAADRAGERHLKPVETPHG